jgi:cation diffusion facilitator family transporter
MLREMDACCEDKTHELDALRARHARTLRMVLAVNAAMFLVEVVAGLLARSTAVLADSLDMFGDATVYGLSLYALSRGVRWRARAALAKGALMGVFGVAVIGQALVRSFQSGVPEAGTMGVIGVLALTMNGLCFLLLYRHRSDDLNMRSTWLCSRNDVLANVGVLAASGAVALLNAGWPDLLVGLVIALLFLHSAVSVARAALRDLAAISNEPAAVSHREGTYGT